MIHSSGKRELIFFIATFTVFYLITASVMPHLGVRMGFLSFGADIAQNAVKPDIMAALVICSAILSSRRRTVILGIVFGFLVDVTCFVPVFSALIYCICAHYAQKLSYAFSGKGVINAVFAAAPLLLIKSVVSAFYLLGTWHNIGFADILAGAVIPEYICNLVAVAVVYVVLSLLMTLFKIEKTI
ncbi:MAG: hypothetical protein IKU43_05055 [Clostridia bacterium]|nr:hypothetical protein [Clostridia bacterium]